MRNYRLTVLLNSQLKKEKKQKLLSDITAWLGDVTIKKTTELGEQKLAYPIRSVKSADYVLIEFEGSKVALDAEKRITIHDDIIRHLMVRMD